FGLLVGFVISGQDPEAFAQRLQNFAAAVKSLGEIGEVTIGDVDVRRLGDDALQRAKAAMDIAENQHFHFAFPACGGRIFIMRCTSMLSAFQASSFGFPPWFKKTAKE